MREIRFRVWNKKEKIMIYDVMCGFYKPSVDLESHFEISYADHEKKSKRCLAGGMGWFDRSFPVMQYTGLNDKRRKKIYEGDVVSFNGNMTADNTLGTDPNGFIFTKNDLKEVVWNDEQACWDVKHLEECHWKYRRDCHHLLITGACEIIGNIYSNLELLGGKHD